MEKQRGIVNFVVKYNSDPTTDYSENHKSDILSLVDVDERGFDDQDKAIIFLNECTFPITTIEELVPTLKDCKKFNYVLSNRNIRPKHQLRSSMDEVDHGEW